MVAGVIRRFEGSLEVQVGSTAALQFFTAQQCAEHVDRDSENHRVRAVNARAIEAVVGRCGDACSRWSHLTVDAAPNCAREVNSTRGPHHTAPGVA